MNVSCDNSIAWSCPLNLANVKTFFLSQFAGERTCINSVASRSSAGRGDRLLCGCCLLRLGRAGRCRFCLGSIRFCFWFIIGESSDIGLFFYYDSNNFTKRNILGSLRVQQGCYKALFLHFKIDCSFIGFDSSKDIAGLNLIANFFVPRTEVSLKL